MFTKLVERLSEKLSPTATALVMFPAYLLLSLPISYITGAFAVIVLENIFTNVVGSAGEAVSVGWGVGIFVAVMFASWAAYGSYHLSKEVDAEPGKDAVSA
jgi:hypothetical protein